MTIQNQILASRYHILKNIGSGAFGVTFLAQDQNIPTQPKCVVKQLKPLVNDPTHLEQAKKLFEKEAAILSKVGNHNQIPYLKDYFEEEGDFYLVQDFVDGTPLDQELIVGQQWSESAVLSLLKDCLPLLDFIHSQTPPIIHRDIKPANLIRRHEDGKIVLVDFGAVKESFQTKLVQSTVAIGTRGYMPTEQIRGKPRPASDIFALGMVAIQALTGVNPIDLPEDENGELVWQYLEDENSQLQQRVTVSAGLADVLSKMIRHEFKNRYQSACDVIEALENLNTKPQPDATSVILPETLDGIISPQQDNEEIISTPQSEQETVKQDSAISEEETFQQQPVTPNQSSSSPSDNSSSMHEQSEQSVTPSPEPSSKNQVGKWLKSPMVKNLGIASVILIVASLGMYALERNRTIQQEQETQARIQNLKEEVTSLFEQQKYQDCIDKVNNNSSKDISKIQEIKVEFDNKCSLALAESFARAEQYEEALKRTENIEPDSKVYNKAQTQIQKWSSQLVEQGVSEYQKNGNLENLDQVLSALAPSNPVREQAIQQKQKLQQLHKKNQQLLSSAEIALDNEQWEQAKQKAKQLQESGNGYPYWQKQARLILKDVKDALATAETDSRRTSTGSYSTGSGTRKTPPSSPQTTPSQTPSSTQKNTPSKTQEKEVVDLCQDEFAVGAGFCPK